MTLDDLKPLSKVEIDMISRLDNESDAITAILNRRTYLRDNREYISSLCKEQHKGRFACHNEKETVTMPILQQEDY